MSIRLNGWQRLWIFCSLLYLIITIFFSYIYFPPQKHYRDPAIVAFYNDLDNPNIRKDFFHALLESAYPRFKNIDKNESISELKRLYKTQKNDYYSALLKHAFITIIFFLVPVLFFYLFGYGVFWVVLGFKDNK